MRAFAALALVVLMFAVDEAAAQAPSPCITPSWVSTAPMEAWMPPLCSTVTITAYNSLMQPYQVTLTVLGYWNGGYNNIPLVYLQSTYDPNQVWLLDKATLQHG